MSDLYERIRAAVAERRRLAEAATPGTWTVTRSEGDACVTVDDGNETPRRRVRRGRCPRVVVNLT